MLYLCYLCRFKPLRDHLRGFLIAAWAGDKIAEFSFPEISFHFPLRPWFFFVSPAYAGKRADCPTGGCSGGDHPRVCGEKPHLLGQFGRVVGSPPRMRGKDGLAKAAFCAVGFGITPACAGKSKWRNVLFLSCSWDHPRVCGEKAGAMRRQATSGRWDHPRVCGEKAAKRQQAHLRSVGSPPRMRGKGFDPVHPGIACRDHPRMCGEKHNRSYQQERLNEDHPRVCGEKIRPAGLNRIPRVCGKRSAS